jgi:hypothetical protein
MHITFCFNQLDVFNKYVQLHCPTVYMGLVNVPILEASFMLLDLIFDDPVKTVTSVTPSLEYVPFFYLWIYLGVI